ncbi:MAG: hypothetical protein PHG19_03700 [Anaerotignum sp.]|nr:hypothetical protein [Anaerotignum sp.]
MKELKFQYPMITSYQGIANTFAILQNVEAAQSWLFNNYIQLVYYSNIDDVRLHEMTGSFYDLETGIKYVSLYNYCPYFKVQQIDRDTVKVFAKNIVDFLINCINDNNYVSIYLNQFYIPNSSAYRKKQYDNSVIVFGYDKCREMLKTASFYRNTFSIEWMSFADVQKAFDNAFEKNEYTHKIVLLKLRENINYTFDTYEFIKYLADYISGKDHKSKFSFIRDKTYRYGIDYYEGIKECFSSDNYDARLLHILYDHKIVMSERLKYFLRNNYINPISFNELYKFNLDLSTKVKNVENLVLKNNYRYARFLPEDKKDVLANGEIFFQWPNYKKDDFIEKISEIKKLDIIFSQRLTHEIK